MSKGNLLVVGGGIGGLATAIALAGADYDVTVIEKQADLHSTVYGVGIIQPANALRALDAIGCLDACLESGFAAPAWGAMYDVDGNRLFDMSGVHVENEHYPPMNGITRPRLHEILTARALEVGVRIRYSTVFENLEDLGDRVEVTFGDDSAEQYDLVIGADGVRSQVRSYVLDTALRPKYVGQSAFRINLPRLPEIDRIILQRGPNGMAGFVPIGPELAYFFYNTAMRREDRPKPEDLADALREHLEGFGWLTGRVRDEFIPGPEDVVLRPEEALISPAPWHRGRIVLIGDAVHAVTPHLGQGAAQAIEDGVVLADELATSDDHEVAFERYTERRYERCKLVVETCVNIAEWEQERLPGFDNIAATNHVLEVMATPF